MIGASIDALRRVGIEVEIVENGHFYLSGGLSEGYENYASIAVNASHKLVCAIPGRFYTQKEMELLADRIKRIRYCLAQIAQYEPELVE